jgi:large subunit ribosomal protein L23
MNIERLLSVINHQVISEKSTFTANKRNQHVFNVAKNANKVEIKNAIEHIFKVKVSDVNIVNIKGKVKRFKNRIGKRSDFKKAYVTLAAGADINLTDLEKVN